MTPTGPDPVAVDASMVSVWSGSRSLALAAVGSALPLLISPGITTTLTLVTAAPAVGQVEVQIEQQRFRVTLP